MGLYSFIAIVLMLSTLSECQSNRVQKNENEVIMQTEYKHENMDTIIPDKLNMAFILGKFDPTKTNGFTQIDQKFADRAGLWLNIEAYEAFIRMWEAAKKDNIDLIIRSATRNFDYQKGIWERKWMGETTLSSGVNLGNSKYSDLEKAKMILEYSAMPGTSRHHWGTDIDLNAFENDWFEKGEGLRVYYWLENHAHEFGFCRPYTSKINGRTGYNEEKWHWSYMPLSKGYLLFASQHMSDADIQGFLGSKTADDLQVVKNYVLGVEGCGK
ncbi:MAG TPA: M15 family metallopeptidase [Saprospiraceae bacterium]|nr:M15 family metallopeptidase [Saprospiraceae bacterium]